VPTAIFGPRKEEILGCLKKWPNEKTKNRNSILNIEVLLTVHLNIFISVINQLDAQNFVLQ